MEKRFSGLPLEPTRCYYDDDNHVDDNHVGSNSVDDDPVGSNLVGSNLVDSNSWRLFPHRECDEE
ncbi:MAG: hypothetical protein ACE5E7_10025 [Anaerolineae bacterium]